MAFDPSQRFIYVGRKADRSIATYHRNCETGEMSLVGTVPVGIEPDFLAVDSESGFLFSTYTLKAGLPFIKLAAMES